MPNRNSNAQKFYVSRQRYWGVDEDEGTVVEIAYGGLDYANPDMLGIKWPRLGEGKEFSDPREAVEAAIRVCDAWRASGEANAKVAMGSTGGNTLPFEPKEYDEARKRAEELYEKLPKCGTCDCLLGDQAFSHELDDESKFCSESCCEKSYDRHCKLELEDIPSDNPVQPLKSDEEAEDKVTCNTCGLSWDDAKVTGMTPAPAGRCPFEYFHR